MSSFIYEKRDLNPELQEINTCEKRMHSLLNALALFHNISWEKTYMRFYIGTLKKTCLGPTEKGLDSKILRLNYFHGSKKNGINFKKAIIKTNSAYYFAKMKKGKVYIYGIDDVENVDIKDSNLIYIRKKYIRNAASKYCRKQSEVNNPNVIVKNVNPKKILTGDCVVRACTSVIGKKYVDVLDLLGRIALIKKSICINQENVFHLLLYAFNFHSYCVSELTKRSRMSFQGVCEYLDSIKSETPAFVEGHRHVACLIYKDGKHLIQDTWDSSDEKAILLYTRDEIH